MPRYFKGFGFRKVSQVQDYSHKRLKKAFLEQIYEKGAWSLKFNTISIKENNIKFCPERLLRVSVYAL